MPRNPKAPTGLAKQGKALWKSFLSDLEDDWDLDARELYLLERACRCADELALLEKAIDGDGVTVAGSRDQTIVHPALSEARQLRLVQLRLLSSIEMADPSDPGSQTSTPAQAQARRAARSRWGNSPPRRSRGGTP